ncbi:hypothetical protein O1611_g7469 [Lasiodiplodia mahajangana]|uniref:Uncharacterized protein n=1 Tax=Lasiodiplodia mahajangana TaxID=1108764 RepID=A0ACC2JFB9_9PEZI|nr:hypothetical protein O1611_g7469 [Lasiodiplodia mahajangana]
MDLTPIWLRDRRHFMFYASVMIFILGMYNLFRVSPYVALVSTDSYTPIPHFVDEKGHQNPCASLHGLEDVFVIVRTGSNEVYQKLPPLLNTSLPCFRHYGIWSDMEEDFAGQHIANSLDEIDPRLIEHHPEFEYYRHLQEHGRGIASSAETAGWVDAPNTDLGRDTPAWKLDKWKFLPIAKKAYYQHPTSKWYIFIECDTYVLWGSLLAYLSKVDSSHPYYIGRQMNIAKDVFAYGGASIIISNSAMKKLVEQHAAHIEDYNKLTISQWAGDYVLSRVMFDAGIQLSQIWPTLEGETPAALDMKSTSTKGYPIWCYYVASYHHMAPDDIYAYHEFDRSWDYRKRGFPRHGDVFRHMLYPQMRAMIYGWDNLSSDIKGENMSCQASELTLVG